MAIDLVEGKRAVYMARICLEVAAKQTGRPQRMARLHLMTGVAVRLGLRQERVPYRDS
jgi:hypothetical protein